LMISTGGTVSARVNDHAFLITPYGIDRKYLESDDVVLIQNGQREAGKIPSRAVRLHQHIYNDHPHVNCIMTAQPPHATTYSIVKRHFDTRLIPESYILLREMPLVGYGLQFQQPERISALLRLDTPVILLQNDSVLATGSSILQAFDRMEVAEFSAQALLQTHNLGELVPITDEEIANLKRKFAL